MDKGSGDEGKGQLSDQDRAAAIEAFVTAANQKGSAGILSLISNLTDYQEALEAEKRHYNDRLDELSALVSLLDPEALQQSQVLQGRISQINSKIERLTQQLQYGNNALTLLQNVQQAFLLANRVAKGGLDALLSDMQSQFPPELVAKFFPQERIKELYATLDNATKIRATVDAIYGSTLSGAVQQDKLQEELNKVRSGFNRLRRWGIGALAAAVLLGIAGIDLGVYNAVRGGQPAQPVPIPGVQTPTPVPYATATPVPTPVPTPALEAAVMPTPYATATPQPKPTPTLAATPIPTPLLPSATPPKPSPTPVVSVLGQYFEQKGFYSVPAGMLQGLDRSSLASALGGLSRSTLDSLLDGSLANNELVSLEVGKERVTATTITPKGPRYSIQLRVNQVQLTGYFAQALTPEQITAITK